MHASERSLFLLRACLARGDVRGLESVLGIAGEAAAPGLVSALTPEEREAFLLLCPARLRGAAEALDPLERARVLAAVLARREEALLRAQRVFFPWGPAR